MATSNKKRIKMMNHLIAVLDSMDPSKTNSSYYKEKFNPMTDKEFFDYFEKFFADSKANIYLEYTEYENEITIENIERTAKLMNVPLLERVAFPYLTPEGSDTVIVTPYPVPVGYIHQKRMPQTLIKKTAGSTKIEKRSALTGQVTSEDKNARNSNLETYCLTALGATDAMREFMGPRADNMLAKNQLYNDIAKNGYASLDDLTMDDPYHKVALNTLDTYYLMMGIKTNLISKLGEIPGPR